MTEVKRLILKKREKALREFKRRLLLVLGKDVLELKLFGSQTRGNFKKDSDIDVLIVLRSLSPKKEDFIIDLTCQILFDFGVVISPHIYSKKEYSYLNHLPSVFMQILKREALPL